LRLPVAAPHCRIFPESGFEISGSKFPAAAIRKLRLRQDFIYWNSTSSGRSLLA
jgi:hypothetical protein